MEDSTNPRARATAALAELFLAEARRAGGFRGFEDAAVGVGHACMADAMGLAPESLDSELMAARPKSLACHDVRTRTLATEVGDVSFSARRYRDEGGLDVYLLADALDLPYGRRVSPGAAEFLVEAGAQVSYLRAARLLARHGSSVSPTAVMGCLREAGALCAGEDGAAAESLYRDGVVPEAAGEAAELCMEADGTWFRAQGLPEGSPARLEVKALVAYEGKELRGGKVRRRGCVRHALVGAPSELWAEGVAAVGKRYDLSKVERVHLGADGERWCSDAQRWLPRAEVTAHLDPFHVNRAVLSCFPDAKLGWGVVEVLNGGDKREAVALIRAAAGLGLARRGQAERVAGYLEGNAGAIAVEGPSLGTMESENQHLYGARMDSVPCAWSPRGASDMARIISRRESGTPVPRATREGSMGARRRKRREERELSLLESRGASAGKVVESVGSGYLPPHQADTRGMDAGKAYALYRGMAILDRGI